MSSPEPSAPPGAQPPVETERAHVHAPAEVAGGVAAITSTMRHAARQMGLVRGARTLLRTNQMDGFDCPGCAWPEPDDHRSIVEFCENGAKAVASEATLRRADPAFFAAHSLDDLAARSDLWLNEAGRLTHPMVRREGATHYEPIGWHEAFALVAQELRGLSSPNEAAFYTSGRTSNEAAFLYQLFARQYGTNNLPDCSNMCHESSGRGLGEVIGVGKGTVTLDDFDQCDAVFVIGQNPGTNHPRMLATLERAARRGATIVSINPLPEAGTMRFKHPQDVFAMIGKGTSLAKLHLAVKVNGDVAVLKGIMKAMLARGDGVDREFIDRYTSGFSEFEHALAATSWEAIEEGSGVSRAEMEQAAKIACEAKAVIACWAMGITQHQNGVANVQEIVNFLLLRGNIGRPGAGACPVRGHSNVQGDRTMGISERMDEKWLARLGQEFSFEPPRAHGKDVVDSIHAMEAGRIKAFFAMGGNFLSAAPDTDRTARALARCRLTAHVATKLNRGHLVTGSIGLLLPCLGRTEIDQQASGPQFVTVENSMSVVSASRGALRPASEHLLSEVAIVCRLAKATLGDDSRVDWDGLMGDYDRIRAHIEKVVPGFDDYNARVREPGGFHLPNLARERIFKTKSGKAELTVHPIPEHRLAPGQLLMMTIRSHDQYNTTVYGMDDRYRGIHGGRRVVLMNADDMKERGLEDGALVDLTSHFDDGERHAKAFFAHAFPIPRGSAATYFPEANVLVPLGSVAAKSNTPASKSVVISVARAG